jgi:hypothetical protein
MIIVFIAPPSRWRSSVPISLRARRQREKERGGAETDHDRRQDEGLRERVSVHATLLRTEQRWHRPLRQPEEVSTIRFTALESRMKPIATRCVLRLSIR